jgi:hypothetical protein
MRVADLVGWDTAVMTVMKVVRASTLGVWEYNDTL